MIDPKKPLRFRRPDSRPVKLIGVTSTGDIIVETTSDKTQIPDSDTILQFRPDGTLHSGRDCFAPVLVNDIVIDRGFYAMDTLGPMSNTRGLTMLHGIWSDYPSAKFALEIVRHDGVPKEAHIHVRS